MAWKKFNGESLSASIKDEVRNILSQEIFVKDNKLKVYIGTDSLVKHNIVEMATVIVFLRKSKGGFMFVNNEKYSQTMHIKERMLLEVSKSIEIAYELCDMLIEFDVEMEVHADINTNPQFKSNDALKDAMGYIMGMGFSFKAKPDAFASSCCADKAIN
ncbi:MAG: hypothetical protein RL188_965 [Bacteroidota bacterium]|jgi:predicted RNase H-related nuclease YkuK (DUF458 family)